MKYTLIFLTVCFSVFSVHAQTNIHDAAGVQTILWSGNGMIGVNNASPQYTLDVTGFSSSAGVVLRNPGCSACDLVLQNIIPTSTGTSTYHLIGMYPGFDPNAIYIGGYNAGESNPFVNTAANKVLIGNPYYNNKYMSIDFVNGGVGIGVQNTNGYQFNVNGSARCNKVVVNTTGADYVFDSSYRLRPLSAVEEYITQYHHLPEVASADSMKKEGLDVGENQITLLKKIEELTLYIIDQSKTIKDMQAEMNELKATIRKK